VYLPASQSAPLLDDGSGIPRRLKRAIYQGSLADFRTVVEEYNQLIRKAMADNTIRRHLRTVQTLPLALVERILSQVYSRTVSPHVRSLARYENGGDNVYGELLPRLVHTIIYQHAAPLDSSSTFIDLGSGVGNVVLQAALATGCDSWGIEQMENPAKLAKAQVREFRARCAMWKVRPGQVHVIHGDFIVSTEISQAIQKADVVLVNNQAFQPQLNDSLVMRLLDLKDGARVVSLKRLGPPPKSQTHNTYDPKNILRQATKYEYGSGCVSWTDKGGEYIVAIKQPMEQ
jgi:[histone H3]-lysine79 N-trimethyltransferase